MNSSQIDAIVVGASAGAIEALMKILPELPATFAIPILVVVHVATDRKNQLVELYQHQCALTVTEAEDKSTVRPGVIYFAPADYHLLVEANHTLSLSNEEAVNFSRPSIDFLFETASDAYEDRLVGIILTGANRDGAQGLKRIMAGGGIGVVQEPSSAHSSAMPQAAIEACPNAVVLTLDKIANYLKALEQRR